MDALGAQACLPAELLDEFEALRDEGAPAFLLESARPDAKHGRETVFGAAPALFLYAKGADVRLWEAGRWERLACDPFEALRTLFARGDPPGE